MSVTEAPTASAPAPQAAGAETDSCHCCGAAAILYLVVGSVLWLLLALLLELVCSVKLHMPSLLAGTPLFTYGRLHAASETALLYGFGVSAGLGTGLWLLCRLGRTRLAGPVVVGLATFTWNSAVTAGVWGIMRGAGTGYPTLEMPATLAPILLCCYLLIGLCGIVTFHNREPAPLYPSQWFVIGALFWFAWIFSAAALLLLHSPVRGVLQASVDWWYQHNFSTVFLGFAGMASIFYFVPKLAGRPLHSRYQAAFAFWMLALAGSWGGIPEGSPLPSWVIGMSVVGTVFTLTPILAVVINLHKTARESLSALDASPTLRFTCAGLGFWVIASAQDVVGALPSVSTLTNFTWFTVAQRELFRYGFFAMTMFGAFYYVVPRLADPKTSEPDGLWSAKLYRIHFWLTLLGVFVGYISLLAAGLWQGLMLNDPGHPFVAVMRGSMMAIRMSTMGPLLVLAGTMAFLLNFAQMMMGCCRRCCQRKEGA